MANAEISSDAVAGPAAVPLDEMLACHIDWREDALAVADAYRRWSHAPAGEEAMWFAAYLAALEQEQFAAESYARAVAGVERALLAHQRRTRAAQPQTGDPRP
jgi:hypothetical protein